MSRPLRISSPANERVKALVRLRGRREREARGLLLVEEPLVIRRALAAGQKVAEVWACPELHGSEAAALYRRLLASGAPAFEVTPAVMAKIAYRERPDGLLLVASRRRRDLNDVVPPTAHPALYLVLEAVEKPGNLGAVLRIADAAGADAVFACGRGADPDNPNCLRASRGACFAVPVVPTAAAPLLTWLRAHGIAVVAAVPAGGASWDECDLTGPVALVVGAEHDGLSPALAAAADHSVTMPMLGAGDSLNVASAAAVLLYEAIRQRRRTRKAE